MARNARELRVDRGAAVDPGITGVNSKIAKLYTFDSSTGVVTCKDADCVRILYIVNQATGESIYNPARPELRGTEVGQSINLQLDTSRMNDSDLLLIQYEPTPSVESVTMESILAELKKHTTLLGKILS